MTSAFSWQNSISLCPASFHIPRPNLPVTPGVSFFFFFVRTTQQNKIPVYCWTTLFHTYIKQAKKINSNFIDKKRKKRNLLSLAFLTISYKPTTYSTAKYIHKKSYWNARNKIVFFVVVFAFFTRFFFSFEIMMNMVTPQVKSE